MRKHQICAGAIIIILTLVSLSYAQSAKDKFVGTWRLISIDDPSPTASKPDKDPVGYIMYDSTGHMAVQIMRRPDRPKFASGKLELGTPEEIKAAFVGYGAYPIHILTLRQQPLSSSIPSESSARPTDRGRENLKEEYTPLTPFS